MATLQQPLQQRDESLAAPLLVLPTALLTGFGLPAHVRRTADNLNCHLYPLRQSSQAHLGQPLIVPLAGDEAGNRPA